MFCLHACLFTTCLLGAYRDQTRFLGSSSWNYRRLWAGAVTQVLYNCSEYSSTLELSLQHYFLPQKWLKSDIVYIQEITHNSYRFVWKTQSQRLYTIRFYFSYFLCICLYVFYSRLNTGPHGMLRKHSTSEWQFQLSHRFWNDNVMDLETGKRFGKSGASGRAESSCQEVAWMEAFWRHYGLYLIVVVVTYIYACNKVYEYKFLLVRQHVNTEGN